MAYQGHSNGFAAWSQSPQRAPTSIPRVPVPTPAQYPNTGYPPQSTHYSQQPLSTRPAIPHSSLSTQELQGLLDAGVHAGELPPQQHQSHQSSRPTASSFTNEKVDCTTFPGWPTEPSRLGSKGVFSKIIARLFGIVLALLPITFLILGGLAKSLDQKPADGHSWGLTLITYTRYGVTIYPILFAAIIGSVMQSISAWLAERGATILVLEQLTGSTALFGTLKTQFQLSAWNYRTLLLLLLWTLSPLGGQGNLRLISVENRAVVSQSPVWFLNSSMAASSFDPTIFNEDSGPEIDPINAVYLSSIIAPNSTQTSLQDTWGNIKVPRIESLVQRPPQSDRWYDVPNTNVSYSSLVGVPVANLPSKGNSTFIMSSSYYELTCSDPKLLPTADEVIWSFGNGTGHLRGTGNPVTGMGSQRFPTKDYSGEGNPIVTFSIGSLGPFTNYSQKPSNPMSIYFQSETDAGEDEVMNITALNCLVTFSNVDSKVQCVGPKCRVASMRLSPGFLFPDLVTPLSSGGEMSQQFYSDFAVASGYYDSFSHFTTNSLLEQYMKYGFTPLGQSDRMAPTNLSKIDGPDLAVRLARAMNSFWLPALAPMQIAGSTPPAKDFNGVTTGTVVHDSVATSTTVNGFDGVKTTATVTVFQEIFVCHSAWLAVLLISAFILLTCAIFGLFFQFTTVGPEIFGHVSSLTRDNPYVRIPKGGSTLSGFERAKLLGKMKIRVADVKVRSDIGHIAIVSTDRPDTIGLDKKRWYD